MVGRRRLMEYNENWLQIALWVIVTVILGIILYELFAKEHIEGFMEKSDGSIGDSPFWARMVPRRGDIGPEQEEGGYISDPRYYSGYNDVQRFGTDADYCRMVEKESDPKSKCFACALGGTENLSSIDFRTPTVREGFVLGRDDYMRDVNADGRDDYCRVVKKGNGVFTSECYVAGDRKFASIPVVDPNPPSAIRRLLRMYENCSAWLRLRDDMVDYAQNLYVSTQGGAKVDESIVNPEVTQGLRFNGINQYVLLGDDPYMNFGETIQLRNTRAIMFWVKFDEFTNNAHIFDFGNGAGVDNVWVGIVGRGNYTAKGDEGPKESGPGDAFEMTLESYKRSVDEGKGLGASGGMVDPNNYIRHTQAKPLVEKAVPEYGAMAQNANMIYEVWEKEQRKMRIIIPFMFELGKWTHVCINASDNKSFRPDIRVYKNGEAVYTKPSGWLPQESRTQKNYLGRSNWSDVTSQFDNKDELFKGAMFDFRLYRGALAPRTIRESFAWGKGLLGIEDEKKKGV